MEVFQMRNLFLVCGVSLFFVACAHNPNKAEKIDTDLKNQQKLGPDETVGVKSGNMVVQKKVAMNDELRRLQYEVYELEDRVYGNKKYGSKGLYGALKDCKAEAASTKYGGNGKLTWTEPMDRVTDKEDEWNIGIDEQDKLVGVSDEFLKDRLARFQKYKGLLTKRQDEYEEKLEICDADLKVKREHGGGSQEAQ
jgi:hypothetical protein